MDTTADLSKLILAEREASFFRLRGGYPIPLAGAIWWAALGILGYRVHIHCTSASRLSDLSDHHPGPSCSVLPADCAGLILAGRIRVAGHTEEGFESWLRRSAIRRRASGLTSF